MNPENPGMNLPKTEQPEETEVKLILPTAEEIMAQVEGGLDERAVKEGSAEKEYLQATIDQVGTEQKELKGGIFSKLSERVRKAALIGFAGLSLFAASGSFSNAEAGDRSFAGKIFKQVEHGVLEQVKGGFERGERSANAQQQMADQLRWQAEQTRLQAIAQEEQMHIQAEAQKRQMGIQAQMQREQTRIQAETQRMQAKERLIQAEADRYMRVIAMTDPAKLEAEEAKHDKIMQAIEKTYSSETQYGQSKKDDDSRRSFAPKSRENL